MTFSLIFSSVKIALSLLKIKKIWNRSLHDKIFIFVVVGAVHCVPTAVHAQGIPPGFLQA
jgi:hypothetical protein